MRFRKLGSSDLEVSEISLGSWLTFSGGVEFEQTRACTDAAFEAGIPGPSLRPRRPDRGDDRGDAAGRRLRQGALPGLQRVDPGANPGRDRHRRGRPVRLLPAAVLDALAGARGRGVPALRGERHLADRLVANAKASGIELSPDTLAAIDEALGDAPVRETTLAPAARSGITRR